MPEGQPGTGMPGTGASETGASGNAQTPATLEEALAQIRELTDRIHALNQESAARRIELKKLQDAEAARQKVERDKAEAEKSELDKAQQRLTEMEQALKEAQAKAERLQKRQAFGLAARKLNLAFANAQAEEDAFALADLSGVMLDGDTVNGMEDAVKALQKSRPYLFAASGSPKPGDINAGEAGRQSPMTPEQILERKRSQYQGEAL